MKMGQHLWMGIVIEWKLEILANLFNKQSKFVFVVIFAKCFIIVVYLCLFQLNCRLWWLFN
jgi:hypothetical protein